MLLDDLKKNVIEKVTLTNGVECYVRSVTGAEFINLRDLDDEKAESELLKLSVCDVNGQPILTDDVLLDLPRRTINELREAAFDVNRASKKAKDETRKN